MRGAASQDERDAERLELLAQGDERVMQPPLHRAAERAEAVRFLVEDEERDDARGLGRRAVIRLLRALGGDGVIDRRTQRRMVERTQVVTEPDEGSHGSHCGV